MTTFSQKHENQQKYQNNNNKKKRWRTLTEALFNWPLTADLNGLLGLLSLKILKSAPHCLFFSFKTTPALANRGDRRIQL